MQFYGLVGCGRSTCASRLARVGESLLLPGGFRLSASCSCGRVRLLTRWQRMASASHGEHRSNMVRAFPSEAVCGIRMRALALKGGPLAALDASGSAGPLRSSHSLRTPHNSLGSWPALHGGSSSSSTRSSCSSGSITPWSCGPARAMCPKGGILGPRRGNSAFARSARYRNRRERIIVGTARDA